MGDWDIIEEGCRCKYLGIGSNNCKNSYTQICDYCKNNKLIKGNTKNYYII